MTNKLITFPPSTDCENARWILRHHNVDYVEKPYSPPFFIFATLLHGFKSLPLFLSKTNVPNLKPLIQHFESLADPDKRLIPEGKTKEAFELWAEFNIDMGNKTVIWAYTGLLPHKEIMIKPLSLGTPWLNRFVTKHIYIFPKTILWKLLKLNKSAAAEALKGIQSKFKQVDEILADGRPFLMGDSFTIADMAFAVSGAPLVLPKGYGGHPTEQGPVPTYEQFPSEMKKVVDEMRETAAGKFILKMYKEQRYF